MIAAWTSWTPVLLWSEERRKTHCGKNALCSADIWHQEILLPQPPAHSWARISQWASRRAVRGNKATERSGSRWPSPLSCPQQHLKSHGNHPYLLQLLPKLRHFELSVPVAPQVDAIHIDIRIFAALQRTVSPIITLSVIRYSYPQKAHKCNAFLKKISNIGWEINNIINCICR